MDLLALEGTDLIASRCHYGYKIQDAAGE